MTKTTTLFVAMMLTLSSASVFATGPSASSVAAKTLLGTLTPRQRGAAIATFVRKWGPYVETIYGVDVHTWSQRMVSQFAVGDATNIQRALGRSTFEGAMAELNGVGQRLTDKQAITMLASSSFVPGSIPAPNITTPTPSDLVYTAIAPCRLVDSRVLGGAIPANTSFSFHAWGQTDYTSQGGSATDCGLSAESPSAAVLNITVVGPVGAGYLTAYAYGTPKPGTASVNYTSGAIVNNTIITPLAPGTPAFDFTLYSLRQTNVVVDIVGFFDVPHATALDCVTNSGSAVPIPDNGASAFATAPTCAATYTQASVFCITSGNEAAVNETDNNGCFFIDARPGNMVTNSGSANAVCCRVPGR